MPMRWQPGRQARARAAGQRAARARSAWRTAPTARRSRMSGGEQQRTAIATALANQPRVLLADEPTGELDTATALDVFAALQTANTELGATILVVTHDPAVSAQVRRTIAIRDGRTSTRDPAPGRGGRAGDAAHDTVEYAVLDRAGRVQLPREMTEPPRHARPGPAGSAARPHRRVARPWPPRPACAGAMSSAEARRRPLASRPAARPSWWRCAMCPGPSAAAPPPCTRCAVSRSRSGEGQLVAVRGRSGSGKTTLLNIIGGLDAPTRGTVHVAGQDVTAMTERERLLLRRGTVAFIFQSFGLIPMLSAAENVGVPLRITGTEPRQREERVRLLLSVVGPGRARQAAAERAVGRPAAAGRHRPGAGRQPQAADRRRAHRPAGFGDRAGRSCGCSGRSCGRRASPPWSRRTTPSSPISPTTCSRWRTAGSPAPEAPAAGAAHRNQRPSPAHGLHVTHPTSQNGHRCRVRDGPAHISLCPGPMAGRPSRDG